MARPRKQRPLYPKVLVLCEGLTEKNYLLEIKNTLPRENQGGIKIEIEVFKKNDPLNLVKEALRRKQKARKEGAQYDRMWVVFDHDNLPNRDKAFKLANHNNIDVAYSSFNIEVWFLLHFSYSTRAYTNGDEVKQKLRGNYITDYKPGKTRILTTLQSNYETALQHARKLRNAKQAELDAGTPIWRLNPYITLDQLTEFLYQKRKC